MLGAIIGDIVGSIYEFDNIKTKDFPLFTKECFFTDDTVMTIAVAEALLNGGTPDDFINSMKKFGKLYPNSGYGGRFREWLFTNKRKPYYSWGNGSAMRVAPCAWFASSLEEAETLAERSAEVTHNHPEGIKGAKAVAAAIYLAGKREKVRFDEKRIRTKRIHSDDDIKAYIEKTYDYDLSRTLDEIRPTYKFNESCQETVPEAIIAYLESNNFEGAIRNAISLGGDSDTLAAITGSIAEAAYYIPSDITSKTFSFLDDTLSAVINRWLDNGFTSLAVAGKHDWSNEDFSKPIELDTNYRLGETEYARIRYGLFPEEMEDKWFVYFEDGKLRFHRSWTGLKTYEAEITKDDTSYIISKLRVERDPEIYKCTDDQTDLDSFIYLLARGIIGVPIAPPVNPDDKSGVLGAWSNFGRMIT